jgi:hypothetical protein
MALLAVSSPKLDAFAQQLTPSDRRAGGVSCDQGLWLPTWGRRRPFLMATYASFFFFGFIFQMPTSSAFESAFASALCFVLVKAGSEKIWYPHPRKEPPAFYPAAAKEK